MRHRELEHRAFGVLQIVAMSMLLAVIACGDDSSSELPVVGDDAGPEEDDDSTGASGSGGGSGASAGRSGAGGGSNTSSGGAACGGKECKSPATCSRDGTPHCVCPAGYNLNGDGTQCDDVDECKENKDNCAAQAACKNTPGSFECECKGPAYKGDGKSCECADGYAKSEDGLCLASDGKACGDNLDCANNHCVSGICCAVSCDHPEICQATEGATCEGGEKCVYPTAKDGASCDDGKACTQDGTCKSGSCEASTEPEECDDKNPCTDDSCEEPTGCLHKNNTASCDDNNACTSMDACVVGKCTGRSTRDCSAQSNVCNIGECNPENGQCRAVPRPSSVMCNDGNSCTPVDMCMDGTCSGSGNACGPNATACTAGSPNSCTCKDGFVVANGVCVPMDNECEGDNACSEFADCFDPSNVGGDIMCTCRPGYTGDGTQCTRSNLCADNPCGADRGTCVEGNDGKYTCNCAAGFKFVGNTCACDMGGTFGVRSQLTVRWENVEGGIADGSTTYDTFFLERHTYDETGKLSIEVRTCGSTSFDLCGRGQQPFFGAEAYAEFYPVHIWDLPSMPTFKAEVSLPNAVPGQPFTTPNISLVHGITLNDPLGAWPATRADISGSSAFDGSAVNGAAWVDHDGDNQLAITDVTVPPGGLRSDGTPPDPITQFGSTSQSCGSQYAYWPALPDTGLTPVRISKMHTGTRLIQSYQGTITSCDEYGGNLGGPVNGKPRLDIRVGSCMRVNGNSETNCSARSVDTLDGTEQSQEIVNSTFKAKRMAGSGEITCADVRAVDFD